MYKVSIRPLIIEDASVSWKWRNDPEVWKYTGQRPDLYITEEIERDWLSAKLQDESAKRFAILVDDFYVGNIQLTDLEDGKKAQYHIFIGEKFYLGKGIATLASAQLLRYAKYELKLEYIFLHVSPENSSAIRVYEKLGFSKSESDTEMQLNLQDLQPPFVSVFMITYNHVQYIQQAVEGVINQQSNFDFELVVGDDCSKDGTSTLLRKLCTKYPGKIRLLLNKRNLGAMQNQVNVLNECKGKYIAICEGDDYWTDPYKLQKQVDALEQNQQAVLCFHPMTELHLNGDMFPQKNSVFHRPLNDRIALLQINFISTLTVVFRNDSYNRALFRGFQAAMGDYILYLSLLQSHRSQIIYLPEYMGVYRFGRPQSVSNAIPMERFHSDFIRILQYAKKLPYQWSSIEIACIYLASSREWLNLYKSKMNRKAVFAAIRCWLMSIRCIIQSKLHDTRPIEGAISMNGFLFQTKRGLSFLFQKRRS